MSRGKRGRRPSPAGEAVGCRPRGEEGPGVGGGSGERRPAPVPRCWESCARGSPGRGGAPSLTALCRPPPPPGCRRGGSSRRGLVRGCRGGVLVPSRRRRERGREGGSRGRAAVGSACGGVREGGDGKRVLGRGWLRRSGEGGGVSLGAGPGALWRGKGRFPRRGGKRGSLPTAACPGPVLGSFAAA